MKEAVNYTTLEFPELLSLAMTGNRDAAAEIIRRQDAQKAEIEQLKVKANSKTRAPKAEKTPIDMAKDNAYFRCALLVKEFGVENITLKTLTAASAYLDQGLAQGNLRQAFNRVSQVLKAQAVTETVFPAWVVEAGKEIPVLDENKKLEEEGEAAKVERINEIILKYIDGPENSSEPENSEQLPPPPAEIVIPAAPAPAPAASKKAGKK